jgi:hypothetical protein
MSQPVSTVHGPLWISRQDNQGSAATSGWKKFHRVSGKVSIGKEAGKADWLDGSRYADSYDYISSIQVTGQFTVHGSADAIGSLAAWALGDDAITGSGPYAHEITSASTIPYLTIITALGEDPVNQIHEHYDCQITSLVIEGSADADVLTAQVEVVGIHPGKVRATEPTAASESEEPLLHYNAEDTFTLAGLNGGDEVKTVNQARLTVSNGITAYYGDSVRPVALVPGRGEITVDFTVLADEDSLELLNNYYYGTPAPANGDEPTASVFKEGFSVNYSRGAGADARGVQIDIPELVYSIEEYPEADAGGDPIEIACTGAARVPEGGDVADIITITATTTDDESYTDGSSPPSPPGPSE